MVAKKSKAFSLMEVMIAMVIIGILATFAIPGALRMWKKVNINHAKGTMATIQSALIQYKEDMGHFPTQREGGTDALFEQPNVPGAEGRWDGSYMPGHETMPDDPWKNPFEINFGTDIQNKKKYRFLEIICTSENGPDDESDNFDIGA